MIRPLCFALLAACAGCESSTPSPASTDAAARGDAVTAETDAPVVVVSDAPDVVTAPACALRGAEVVTFATSDGVTLEAELRAPDAPATRGVVLLHMIPPSNNRENYPSAFLERLRGRGFAVLNVDRRGAGGSEGEPRDAYLGPAGALDVAAARAFLAGHPCGPAASAIAVVAASNGTTSMVDDAVGSAPGPAPAAMVFLTGGAYTDAQNRVSNHLDRLGATPALLVYARSERDWSVALQARAPGGWEFQEYDPGAHGSRMLTAEPASMARVAEFLERVITAAPR